MLTSESSLTPAKQKPKGKLGRYLVIGVAIFFAMALIGSFLPENKSRRYAWQNQCDDRCAAVLGASDMRKYDSEDCSQLKGDVMLYAAFKPSDVEHYDERMAAIRDRIAYERCQ